MEYHSFLLTLELKGDNLIMYFYVSVSLWSIIHSYISYKFKVLNKIEVSVSLWSIIHSYATCKKKIDIIFKRWFPSPYGVSFILISIQENSKHINIVYSFPSPYGVSFILI